MVRREKFSPLPPVANISWKKFLGALFNRAFFKDFPVGGAFFGKGPFCEIIYYREIAIAEGHMCDQHTMHA